MSREKVLGLGGVFVRAKNAEALRKWYFRHLGVDITEWGGAAFAQTTGEETYWSVFEEKSDYIPKRQLTMLNWKVDDLDKMLDWLTCALTTGLKNQSRGGLAGRMTWKAISLSFGSRR
jgi:hypothetical protein